MTILSGLIVASVFVAFVSVLKYLADPEDTLPAIVFWLMGSFSSLIKTEVFKPDPAFYVLLLRNLQATVDDEYSLSGRR